MPLANWEVISGRMGIADSVSVVLTNISKLVFPLPLGPMSKNDGCSFVEDRR